MGTRDDILVFNIMFIQFIQWIDTNHIGIQIEYSIDFIWNQYR